MKFTSKKTVSEVVLDLEDGCVLKLTKLNLINLTLDVSHSSQFSGGYCKVDIEMKNGIIYQFKTIDDILIENLQLLVTY